MSVATASTSSAQAPEARLSFSRQVRARRALPCRSLAGGLCERLWPPRPASAYTTAQVWDEAIGGRPGWRRPQRGSPLSSGRCLGTHRSQALCSLRSLARRPADPFAHRQVSKRVRRPDLRQCTRPRRISDWPARTRRHAGRSDRVAQCQLRGSPRHRAEFGLHRRPSRSRQTLDEQHGCGRPWDRAHHSLRGTPTRGGGHTSRGGIGADGREAAALCADTVAERRRKVLDARLANVTSRLRLWRGNMNVAREPAPSSARPPPARAPRSAASPRSRDRRRAPPR